MTNENQGQSGSLNITADRFEIEEKPNNIKRILVMIAMFFLVIIGIFALMYVYFLEYYDKKEAPEPTAKYQINERVPEFKLPEPKANPKPEPEIIAKIEPKPEPVIIYKERIVYKTPVVNQSMKMLKRQMNPQLGSAIKNTDKGGSSSVYGAENNQANLSLSNNSVTQSAVKILTAKRLPDLNLLIAKGTPIPCALNTAIQSDQAGIITCTVNEDIYSANGATILIDRGAFVTGEYKVGSMAIGKGRIFAIWDRIRMPDGVVIELDSNATGPLGRGGIGGYVDNHYLERFGVALLVSMIDDVIYSKTHSSSGDNTVTITNQRSDIADDIIKDFRRIQPTLHQHQGAAVNIMVAHDLNFSSVYGLENVN